MAKTNTKQKKSSTTSKSAKISEAQKFFEQYKIEVTKNYQEYPRYETEDIKTVTLSNNTNSMVCF